MVHKSMTIFTLLLFTGPRYTSGSPVEVSPVELTNLPMAYSFCPSYPMGCYKAWDSEDESLLLQQMHSKMEALPYDIPRRLAFTGQSYTVQSNASCHFSGSTDDGREDADSNDGVLFVTTPIRAFGDKVLEILTSAGPVRTAILSVEPRLDVKTLYDTHDETFEGINMCEPRSIGVIEHRLMLLEAIGDDRSAFKVVKRRHQIDWRRGEFAVAEMQENRCRSEQ